MSTTPDPPDESSSSSPSFLPSYPTADAFNKASLKTVASCISASNGLPSEKKGDWAFYSTFPAFREVMAAERSNVAEMINRLLKWNGIKGKCPDNAADLQELLTEINDQLLERINTNLDEAAGLKKEADPMLLEVTKKSAVSGSWNKRGGKEQQEPVKLVTAKNVARPQLAWKDLIDNSTSPFVPALKEKPNSKKPLSVLVEYDENEREHYSHPYLYELDLFGPKDAQLQDSEPSSGAPKPLGEAQFVFVERPEQLKRMITALKKETAIAVDLEHHWYRSFQGFTALIQISTVDTDFVIDPFALRRELTVLNEVFTDENIVKVFHGSDNDLMWLQRDFSVYVVNLFDTHLAAKKLNFPQGSRGYAFLLYHYQKVKADKQFQLADWRIRPLPQEMLDYARTDTRYLVHIYRQMKSELIAQGNEYNNLLRSVIDEGTDLCRKRYSKPDFHESSHLYLLRKSRSKFNSRQLYALRDIFAWRDKVAREEDESVQYVLPNHMLLKICTELPREMQGILACCNPIPPLVKHDLQSLHLIVLKAREQALTVINHDIEEPKMPVVNVSGAVDIFENPLRTPLDLSYVDNVIGGPDVEKARVEDRGGDLAVTLFDEKPNQQNLGNSCLKENGRFLSPYLRYKMLKPYLKQLDEKQQDSSEQDKAHADKIKSIREHFDMLTSMTPDDFNGEEKEDEEIEEGGEEEEEEEEEDDEMPVDDAPCKPLRGQKADKNFNKKRKRQQQNKAHHEPAKKVKEEVVEVKQEVDYSKADFKQFNKGKDKGANDSVYDPWKGYNSKHKKGGGKQKQKFKNSGKSMSYKK